MTTRVNFEIAKLLKEKGFEQNAMKYINQATMEGTVVFPTIGEVVMWLYKKHGIWISVDIVDNTTEFYFYPTITTCKEREYHDEDMTDQARQHYGEESKTPTEAYLAGIEYTLEKLI